MEKRKWKRGGRPLTGLGLEIGKGKTENKMRKLEPDSRLVWL
jgi:hypothetical protein